VNDTFDNDIDLEKLMSGLSKLGEKYSVFKGLNWRIYIANYINISTQHAMFRVEFENIKHPYLKVQELVFDFSKRKLLISGSLVDLSTFMAVRKTMPGEEIQSICKNLEKSLLQIVWGWVKEFESSEANAKIQEEERLWAELEAEDEAERAESEELEPETSGNSGKATEKEEGKRKNKEKLGRISGKKAMKKFVALLGEPERIAGSHHIFKVADKDGKTETINIPMHGSMDVKIDYLKQVLTTLHISVSEFKDS
jgi:predicted RNA binding protein YcfA (HicA-like mRNA interferase family)